MEFESCESSKQLNNDWCKISIGNETCIWF